MARGKKNTGEDPARTEETIKLGPTEDTATLSEITEEVEPEPDNSAEPTPEPETKPDGVLCTIEGFADLTYDGVKYKRGDKVLLKETHYKKFQRWVKKV